MKRPFDPYTAQVISRQAAINAGLKQYFTGEPCKRGHIAPRFTANTGCTFCMSPSRELAPRGDGGVQYAPSLKVRVPIVASHGPHRAAFLQALQRFTDLWCDLVELPVISCLADEWANDPTRAESVKRLQARIDAAVALRDFMGKV